MLSDADMATIDVQELQEFKQGLADEWVVENMKSNMGTLTAAEWRHWTLVSSGYCLFDLIPQKYLDVWEHFVRVCTLLSPACIQYEVLAKVDHHLKEFGKGIGGLFGPAAVTPNMHMQMHMTEVVQQYGPLYACWLFAFERYNGVLGDIQTNNKQIEVQVMRRFMEGGLADTLEDKLPEGHAQHFANMLPSRERVNLTVQETMHIPEALHMRECEELWRNCTGIVTHGTETVTGFYQDDFQLLRQTYRVMYPSHGALLEEKYDLDHCTQSRSAWNMGPTDMQFPHEDAQQNWIMACWCTPTGQNQILRPGLIHYFVKHALFNKETKEYHNHYFARVTWHKRWTEQ